MKPEIRALLGKAAYEAWRAEQVKYNGDDIRMVRTWEETGPSTRAYFQSVAEAVAIKLAEIVVPPLFASLLTEQEIDLFLVQGAALQKEKIG